MHLYLVRHGQTEENLRNEIQGQRPGTLSSTGRQQAQALSLRFRDVALDGILSSDLGRALDTANCIAKYHHLAVEESPLLREQHYGIYQGRPLHELVPAGAQEQIVLHPRGGESINDLLTRARKLWSQLKSQRSGQTILAVSHGAFLSVLLWVIQDLPLPENPVVGLDNASVSLVSRNNDNGYRVVFLNDTSHLR